MNISKNIKQRLIVFCLLSLCHCSLAMAGEDISADWPLYGREYNNQRFSPLDQINKDTIGDLKLAWIYRTGIKATFQTSPIVIDGVMYLTTPFNDVIAVNAKTGQQIWRYQHHLRDKKFCCGPANRGPAVANGKVYSVTIDARLIALEQQTGKLIWDIDITDTDAGTGETLQSMLGVKELEGAKQTGQTGYSANLAPQVYGDKVFVGITGAGYGLHLELEENGKSILSVGGQSGGGHGLRGFLLAYDADTGKELWRWYSVPTTGWQGSLSDQTIYGANLHRDIKAEQATLKKYAESWQFGGGSIWTTPAIDPELGLLYVGTGNPSPQMDDSSRPGDNLYTVSLVALDIQTGELRWHYQQVPHDRWGYDVASPPILFDYQHNGKTFKAIGQASKLGWFFIHDRVTGKLLRKSEPFIPQENLFARPTEKGVRIVPGTLGAASWSPVSYHPGLSSVFISGIYQPSLFYSRKLTPAPGRPWTSYTFFLPANEDDWGLFTAIDTNTGKIRWQNKVDEPMVGGALSTAGDLVFTGEGNGYLRAYDALSGKRLWQYQSQYGVNAPPISYAIDGKQYIAVVAGGNKLFGYQTGDEVLVFRLLP